MAKPKPYIVLYEDDQRSLGSLSDAEVGRLIRTLFEYRATGKVDPRGGREEIILPTFIVRIDRDVEAQAKKSQSYKRNAEKRWMQTDAIGCNCMQLHKKEKEEEKEKEKVTQKERVKEEEKELSLHITRTREDESWRYAIFTYSAQQHMSRDAFDRLADMLSHDDLAHYLTVVEECADQGRPFTDPYEAIVQMARKDGRLKDNG